MHQNQILIRGPMTHFFDDIQLVRNKKELPMKRTQYDKIGNLIKRKQGATPFELMTVSGSTCIHKRMSEMKGMGWTITRKPINGKSYGIYYGKAPK